MISRKAETKMQKSLRSFQRFADRLWYPPLVGFLAALDNLVLIIPNDGILISSSMLTPKRWIMLAICVAIGSTMGAMVLASLVDLRGLPWILETYPGIVETDAWEWSARFFNMYGLLFVFCMAVTPLLQQPAVIIASLANIPLLELAAVIFFGRLIKFLFLAYLGARAPLMLSKLWGMKSELKEVGVKTN